MDELSANEQGQFSDSMTRLFESGFLWRDDDSERSHFSFVLRHRPLFEGFLSTLGWNLVHHERLNMVQILHKRGGHRRKLDKETTIWLLIARLMYAEAKESLKLALTRNPVCSVGDFVKRYAEHFPGKVFRKKQSLEEGLGQLQGLKLIRPAGTKYLFINNTDALVELLPSLEIVVPATKMKEALENLKSFAQGSKTLEEIAPQLN